jgi:hypothetical protein
MHLQDVIRTTLALLTIAVAWSAAVGLQIYTAAQFWLALARAERLSRAAKRSLVAFVGSLVLLQTVLLVPVAIASLPAHKLSRFGGSSLVYFANVFAACFLAIGPFLVLDVCASRLGWSRRGRLLAGAPLLLKLLWVPALLLIVGHVFYWAWVCSAG